MVKWLALGLALALALVVGLACSSAAPAATSTPLPAGGPAQPGGSLPPVPSGQGLETRPASIAYPVGTQNTGLWVSGEGKATAVPDIALLTIGIEVQRATASQAHSEAAAAMEKVMASLKEKGVAEKDIKTQYISLEPVYKWDKMREEQILVGYRAANTISVKVRKLETTGAVIDGVVAAGGDAARIQGISFTLDDPTTYRNQARDLAVKDALAKARQMASGAGVTLGKPYYITESGGYVPTPIPYGVKAMEAGAAVTPVSPGEMEITVSVQMAFAIE